jgi:hypothetical protein
VKISPAGKVTGVKMVDGEVILEVGELEVALADVLTITK